MRRFRTALDRHDDAVTPPEVFFNRRSFIKSSAATIGLAAIPGACAQDPDAGDQSSEVDERLVPPLQRADVFPTTRNPKYVLHESIADHVTPRLAAATHNNYYEFSYGAATDLWSHTGRFEVEPWTVEVTGECGKPTTFDLDDLFKFNHEERLYHFRCVERWAMNVPWSGFPMRALLEKVEPTSHAKYVRLVTVNRPEQMGGMRAWPDEPWPYHEGLRLDEAMNELTMVVTGVYGEPLLKQHGAPVRVIAPWKYGYKNPKSIVKIELLREQPSTYWFAKQPHEYGFLSNVNPNIPHPRWSQARSYWVGGDRDWFPTPIFNGYAQQVAKLYPDEPTTPQQPLRRGQTAR